MKLVSTSISKRLAPLAILLSLLGGSPAVWAADAAQGRTAISEEEDFTHTPFTEYGEFNEDRDEDADAKFFAHGRFFGVSGGLGYQAVSGNRGLLYQGGFPLVDFKIHYWFDFNFALDLGMYFSSHYYDAGSGRGGRVDVNFVHMGIDAKYYFDTKNIAAAVSFANPFVAIGVGSYTQTKRSFQEDNVFEPDTSLGMKFGVGLEFAISPKKAYLQIEGKYHMVNFKDTTETQFQPEIPDLTGGFYTLHTNIMFTW